MNEVISFYQDKINNSKILDDLSINNQNFIVLSCHREENIEPEKKFQKFVTLLNKLSLHFKCPIVVTAHPRTKNRIIESQCSIDTNVILHEPFSFTDYCKLQKNILQEIEGFEVALKND